LSREEWEREIPLDEAEELLAGCRAVVEKTRYLVRVGCHTFEVDEFHGSNEGLLLAEVELASPDEAFERPAWLGREVTGEKAYYNSQIALRTLKKEVER
jgi:CYTH domain-containing protein